MFFDRFVARLRPHSSQEGQKIFSQTKEAAVFPKELTLLQFSKNLNSIKELNAALKEVDQAIQGKSVTNQQLLLKAEILLRKSKIQKSKELLTSISQDKKDQNSAKAAKHLLKILPQLLHESSKKRLAKLIDDLHKIAEKYERKLQNLPPVDNLPPDFDITHAIRREGAAARSAELPGLSLELITRTLQDEQESLWLLHDKALTLNMMGQSQTARQILRELKKSTRKEKLTDSINKNIADLNKNSKHYQSKSNLYLAKQLRSTSAAKNLDTTFLPDDKEINAQTKIKPLTFRKARSILTKNPKDCLYLVSSILDYHKGDRAALLLQGEALAALNKIDEAVHIWGNLARSQDDEIAQKASELISQTFTEKAKQVSAKNSPKAALLFFIQQHLIHGVTPTINKDIKEILQQLEPSEINFSDPELENHNLQLLFNTHLVECLEARLRDQSRLDASATAQQTGAIRKTAQKAG